MCIRDRLSRRPEGSPGSKMGNSTEHLGELAEQEYKYGFVTAIDSDAVPPGLNEDIVR